MQKVISSPAKINLFLHVTEKRPDGYHEIKTLMCPIDLLDTVTMTFGVSATTVVCNHPEVPDGTGNIAYKAARFFYEAASLEGDVAVYIDKKIPVAAGLGGGSSNAAAVLRGLNEYYGRPLTTRQLMTVGLQAGADVPFFVFGRPAFATGIGEKLEHVAGLPCLWVVLVHPRIEISTAWVYQNLNLRLTICEENNNVAGFLEDFSSIQDVLCNDLEQVTAREFPEIESAKAAVLQAGAKGALMSGSGPTVFGLFENRDQAVAAFEILRQNQTWDTFLVRTLP
jgi:4-diphosphocytidyl-2-C-methyl-D-erythritol kinase